MRISKKYNERLNEILDAGEFLFSQKGYEKTTVNDILNYVGIGKGTFYHYFKSKEDVMDAVIMRVIKQYKEISESISNDRTLNAHQKFAQIVLNVSNEDENKNKMIEELHKVENAKMHQKSIVESIKAIAPILTGVIYQGIEEGVFNTPYPQEIIEIILVANQFLFDRGMFLWNDKEIMQKVEAFVYSMELLLGAEPGSFRYILEFYKIGLGEVK